MDPEKIKKTAHVIGENIAEEQEIDFSIIDDYRDKFKQFKLNWRARKRIAKELNISEKAALNWKTIGDVFAFIDSSTLAKEHPKEAARILKLVAGILGAIFPVVLPVTGIIVMLPQKAAASLVEWLGKPTPEHVIHKIADSQAERAKNKLIEGEQDSKTPADEMDKIERLHSLYQRGILTEEEFQTKKQELLDQLH